MPVNFRSAEPSIVVLGLCALLTGSAASADLTQDDTAAITAAIQGQYIEGLRVRDFSLITAICIPEARMMSVRGDGELAVTTLEEWSQRFDPKNPPFKSLEATIAKVDVTGTAAQVRIDFIVDGTRKVTDYLNMLKIAGHWRIVSIIEC
jgi:hypothetical protein